MIASSYSDYRIVDKARDFAIEAHGNQKYGYLPYTKHLYDVDIVLMRFGYEDDVDLRAAAWLHDVLEDTNTDYSEILKSFGKRIADLVNAVTNGEGANRKERQKEMFEKLLKNVGAIPLKIADRIANVEWSILTNHSLLKMYVKEHSYFTEKIAPFYGHMWNHLEYLISLGKVILIADNLKVTK